MIALTLAAMAAAAAATLLTLAVWAAAHGLHALASGGAVAALWAVALWAGRRAHARYYHRHRYEHAKCHAKPTLAHRARLAVGRLRTVRIQTTDTTRSAAA